MKDCAYYESLISRLLDGDLTAQETDELRAHMDACPRCAGRHDALAAMTAALRADRVPAPAELSRGVMERIAADKRHAAPRRKAPSRRVAPWMRVAAAACLVFAVGAGVLQLRSEPRSAASADTAAAPPPIADDEPLSPALSAPDAADMTAADDGSGVMAVRAEDGAIPTVSAQDMTVLDGSGAAAGVIPAENAAAFTAMLVDGQVLSDSGPDRWIPLYTVSDGENTFLFGTDPGESQLIWWRQDSTTVTRSPASVSDLRSLITADS